MMCAKSALLAVFASSPLLFTSTGFAQTTIGPDSAGYMATVDTLQTMPWTDVSSTGTGVLNEATAGTSAVGPINLGFSFEFYGITYSSVYIRADGLISFGAPIPLPDDGTARDVSESFTSPPSQDFDHPAIAVMWDVAWRTLDPADQVYYETQGTGTERQFIVQWNQLEHAFADLGTGTNSDATFQVVLFETSNIIEMRYLDTVVGGSFVTVDDGEFASVGIRDVGAPGNSRFLQWSSRINEPNVTSGMSIQWVPPGDPPSELTPLEQLLVSALESLIDSLEAASGVTIPSWLADAMIASAQAVIDLIVNG